jgi:hypothetical protein
MTHVIRIAALVLLDTLLAVALAAAQTGSGLSRAVDALNETASANGRLTLIQAQRLFGGVVTATIVNNDNDPDTIGPSDCINFFIAPRAGTGSGAPAPQSFSGPRSASGAGLCGGTQGSFEDWARSEPIAPQLLRILFPGSLGAAVLGRSPSELHAQQLLFTTALATEGIRSEGQGQSGRAFAGGLIESEWLRKEDRQPGDAGWAWQGIYGINRHVAVQGRFARQREFFTSSATTFSVDYHPFIEIDRTITWRIGGTGRAGVLYSSSNAMDLGSLEFGGGGWASGFKEIGRVRAGGGAMLQGSRSWVPTAFTGDGDDLAFLANAINDRGILYDLTFGGTTSVDTSERTRVIVKVLENTPLSLRDDRANSWLLSTGLSYRIGLPTLNVGYKLYSTSTLRAHSLFFQGNFDW